MNLKHSNVRPNVDVGGNHMIFIVAESSVAKNHYAHVLSVSVCLANIWLTLKKSRKHSQHQYSRTDFINSPQIPRTLHVSSVYLSNIADVLICRLNPQRWRRHENDLQWLLTHSWFDLLRLLHILGIHAAS